MVGTEGAASKRGFLGGMLVRHLWAVVAVVSVQVTFSVALWAGRRDGASSTTVGLAWAAYVGALVTDIASLAVALGPVRRARSDRLLLGWVVATILLLAAAVGLAVVPTRLLPAAS